jgi:hypothetical protein
MSNASKRATPHGRNKWTARKTLATVQSMTLVWAKTRRQLSRHEQREPRRREMLGLALGLPLDGERLQEGDPLSTHIFFTSPICTILVSHARRQSQLTSLPPRLQAMICARCVRWSMYTTHVASIMHRLRSVKCRSSSVLRLDSESGHTEP